MKDNFVTLLDLPSSLESVSFAWVAENNTTIGCSEYFSHLQKLTHLKHLYLDCTEEVSFSGSLATPVIQIIQSNPELETLRLSFSLDAQNFPSDKEFFCLAKAINISKIKNLDLEFGSHSFQLSQSQWETFKLFLKLGGRCYDKIKLNNKEILF